MDSAKMGLVAVAVLLLCIASVHALLHVAPGDEDGTCMNRIDPYPSNIVMLMSSWHYLDLIGDGGCWKTVDCDTNNSPYRFYYTNWIHSIGGTCRRNVKSCGSRRGWQDNWLFTQFINKTVPANTQHTVKAIVKISYTITACRERYGCYPQISVLSFVTTGPQPREVCTNKTNYELIAYASGMTRRVTDIIAEVEIPVSDGGFYLAVRDNSSCIQISKIEVCRYQCVKKRVGLVVFQDNAAPVGDQMTVMAECMPNSSPMQNMAMTCNVEGAWNGTSRCRCDPGYYRIVEGEDHSCKPCKKGTYRSGDDPENECLACPANTELDEKAAPICRCLPGYYRNDIGQDDKCPAGQQPEDASYGCTQPSSEPRSLTLTESSESSLNICWSAPSSLGGRSDIYHRVHYNDPDKVGVMLEADCSVRCLTDTCCNITGLRGATRYLVRVSSHNGVSDQERQSSLTRMETITVDTKISRPSAPQDVKAFSKVVVWGKPSSNDTVSGYEVVIGNQQLSLDGDSRFYEFSQCLSSGMLIKISAFNDAGYSPYANTTISDGCGTPTPDTPTPIETTTTVVITPATVTSTQYVTTTASTRCPTPTPHTCPTCPPPALCPNITCPPCVATPNCPIGADRPNLPSATTTQADRPASPSTTTTRAPPVKTSSTQPTVSPTPLPTCEFNYRARPSGVTGIVRTSCNSFKWDVATIPGCTDPKMIYRIRIFNGPTYGESTRSRIFSSKTNSFSFTPDQISFFPVNVIVKARRDNGQFSSRWSSPSTPIQPPRDDC